MQNFWFTIFFLLLTYAPSSLSYASASAVTLSRRHLYDDEDPSLPPPLTPTSPPFFPLDSFTPPLPPPPPPPFFSAFPTFPANISALVLPRSSKPHSTSPTFLVPALSAVLAVATAIGLALFLYGRYRGQNRHFKDTHSHSSNNTRSYEDDELFRGQNRNFKDTHSRTNTSRSYEDEDDGEQSHITTNFNMAATTSPSEVFYIRSEESDHIRTGDTCFFKSESPEIRPLPPLPPRSFQPNYKAQENEEDDEEDEEEEFYSPLASLAGSLNSSPSHSCSSSCSGWVSPARSFSNTMSPPNPRYSDACNLQSPSPERLRVRKNNNGNGSSSLRMFSFWNQNIGFKFPRISSASTSPDRGTIRTPLSSLHSSVSTSPDGLFRKFLDSSPPIWNDFSRNVKSVLLSSHSLSSRRDFVINIGESSSSQQNRVPALPPPTRPPPLVPPSQPFVAPTKLSVSELPTKQLQWERLRSSSLKLNKEMVETLFIANSSNPNMIQRGLSYELPIQNQESKVLDTRKAQNIATLLQLLKLTTKDVCQALLDGDYDALGVELLECLLRLAPSEEEERKLKSFSDDSVIIKLGPAERFLKELLHVPSVFKRVDALLSVANFLSTIKRLRRLFSTVQAACDELRNSRMFSVLLEAILKTGNMMNFGTNSCGDAHEFKLDTLLKLVEVKGLDGRSSLVHFVVQELVKSEGSTLEGIRNLNSELSNVKKSADIQYDVLRSDVLKLCQRIKKIEELLQLSEECGSSGDQWLKFRERMARFLKTAAEEIVKIKIRECSTLSALEEVTEQFHGDASNEGHTLRIFMIVRDFLCVLDKVCTEMGM